MKKTGQILKAAREKLGMSYVEISMSTKINPKVLAAIESGDKEGLPARTFLRGFIRSYAAYLKLNPEETVRSYMAELDESEAGAREAAEATLHEQKAQDQKSAEQKSSSALPDIEARSRTLKTVAIVSVIALLFLIFVVHNLVEKYEREGTVERPAPSAVPSPLPTESPSPVASAVAEVMMSKPVPLPSPVASPMAAPSLIPKIAPPPPAPKPTPKPTPSPVPSASAIAKKHATENEIIIEALDKVTIKFQINGGPQTEVVLQPDQVHTIKAKGAVNLEASDGGAIDIIVNGRDTGVPGDLGKPKKIKIP